MNIKNLFLTPLCTSICIILGCSNLFAQETVNAGITSSLINEGNKKVVELEWGNWSSLDLQSLIVERSSDDKTFIPLKKIELTSSNKQHKFKDINPLSGKSYYRLTALHADGSPLFSETISVSSESKKEPTLNLYPNPATKSLTIIAQGSQPQGKILITSIEGKQLYSFQVLGSSIETTLDVSYLEAGTYLIIFKDNKGEAVKQFIKI